MLNYENSYNIFFFILGVDHNAVVNTFQTTIMQSGLNPKMVLVSF